VAVGGNLFGLSAEAKARLLQKLASVASGRPGATFVAAARGRRRRRAARTASTSPKLEAYREIRLIEQAAEYLDIADPFFSRA